MHVAYAVVESQHCQRDYSNNVLSFPTKSSRKLSTPGILRPQILTMHNTITSTAPIMHRCGNLDKLQFVNAQYDIKIPNVVDFKLGYQQALQRQF